MFTRTEQMLSPLALVDVANDFVGEKENRKLVSTGLDWIYL